jgi:hypothetical protein
VCRWSQTWPQEVSLKKQEPIQKQEPFPFRLECWKPQPIQKQEPFCLELKEPQSFQKQEPRRRASSSFGKGCQHKAPSQGEKKVIPQSHGKTWSPQEIVFRIGRAPQGPLQEIWRFTVPQEKLKAPQEG